MRELLLLIVLLTPTASLFGQTSEVDAERAVRHALTDAKSGLYWGFTEKELARLGDGSAVELTKIVGGQTLTSSDIDPLLLIAKLSYEAPRLVEKDSDREPRATLFLLAYLDLVASDAKQREKIASTRIYVKDQYDKFSKTRDAMPLQSN